MVDTPLSCRPNRTAAGFASRNIPIMATLFMLALCGLGLLPIAVQARTLTLASDSYWSVTDSQGQELGNAQNLCRYPGAPEGCPQGATLFGAAPWLHLPGANWLWRPDTTTTSSATTGEQHTFKTPFFLCGHPQSATLAVVSDNAADILINGTQVASSRDYASASTTAIPVARLNQGLNMIEAKVTNAANPPGCANQYQCNPAGVALTFTVTDNLDPWPTCQSGGKTYQVGEFENQACPVGQVGSNARVCICVGALATWWNASNTCHTPPPPPVTCTGSNNTRFGVDQLEAVPCPAGQVGQAAHRCQADGQWSTPDYSGCRLPTVGAGDLCGGRDKNPPVTATCPAGTECKSRQGPVPPRPWQCALFGIDCPVRLQTADWYCDP